MDKMSQATIERYYQEERKRNLGWLQLSIGLGAILVTLSNLISIFRGYKTFGDLLFNLGLIAILMVILSFLLNRSYRHSIVLFNSDDAKNSPDSNSDIVSWAHARGLDLKPDGLRCDIGLLGEQYRWFILKSTSTECILRWDELQFISIQPEILRVRRAALPPYYKFILKKPFKEVPKGPMAFLNEPFNAIHIQRVPFYGREQEIIEYINAHVTVPIELRDSLR